MAAQAQLASAPAGAELFPAFGGDGIVRPESLACMAAAQAKCMAVLCQVHAAGPSLVVEARSAGLLGLAVQHGAAQHPAHGQPHVAVRHGR